MITLLVVAALTTGCHRWDPLTAVAPPGSSVDLRLSADGSEAATPLIGPRVATVRGELLSNGADTVRVAVREIETRDGQILFLHGITADLPRVHLADARMRVVDRSRTVIAVALAVAGGVALVSAVRLAGGGGGDLPGGGPTPALVPR